MSSLPTTHFILCTERTGSSLCTLMMNLNSRIISPSEEPFALFFYKKYKNKIEWTEKEIRKFIDDFWLISEQKLNLFFVDKEILFTVLSAHRNKLPYQKLCTLIYLQFFEPKQKNEITVILDKQIKYFFYLKKLVKIYPESKFIILVRDPRVNAIRKKHRNLNAGKNYLYLAALWNNTYKNIEYLQSLNKEILIVKYEDFVSDPESIMKKCCAFIDVPFHIKMLDTEGVFGNFLEIQKQKISSQLYEHLKDFQSGLFQKVHTNKIHVKAHELDPKENDKIVKLTKPLLEKFNYNTSLISKKTVFYTLNDRWQITKAYLFRPLLIQLYLHIPLSIKLIIKRIRK